MSPGDARVLVETAEQALWTPEGAGALDHLHHRGLVDETIRRHHLGWTSRATLPTSDGIRYWQSSGIVIPWLEGDRLALVKIRQPDGSPPKYAEAFRNGPRIYPSATAIRSSAPLVVCEGELDCLLLDQELEGLASVITMGSAAVKPEGSIRIALLRCSTWFIALDADEAGDKASSSWPARAIRVKPPAKDWTAAHQDGIELRRWWVEECFAEEFDRQERAAIMEHDGGLSREDAERAAGVKR